MPDQYNNLKQKPIANGCETMKPLKVAIVVGVAIGIVSFLGIRLMTNRSNEIEDDRLFI